MTILVKRRLWAAMSSASIAAALVFTLVRFHAGNDADTWSLEQQNVNRELLSGIRSLRPELRNAHSVLVIGLSSIFEPWQHPLFLARDLGYSGRWSATIEPGGALTDRSVEAISYDNIHWNDYDLIVIFRNDGRLVGAYTPAQMRAASAAPGGRLPAQEVVRRVESSQFVPQHVGDVPAPAASASPGPAFPIGVVTAGSAGGAVHGVFAATSDGGDTCCWVGPDVAFMVRAAPSARTLALTLYEPKVDKVSATPQIVTTIDSHGHSLGSRRVPDGLTTIVLPLSRSTHASTVVVRLRFSRSFIPSEIGLGQDVRRLAVILRDVAAR